MSFQQGLSGLNASARQLDVIGNNVANANTVGFKAAQAYFSDVFANSLVGGGMQVGIGTSLSSVAQQFGQGNITATTNPLDVAISGNGFFRLTENGVASYSRNGQFKLDKDGYVVTTNGANLTGYPVSGSGQITAVAPAALQVSTSDVAPAATSAAGIVVNLDARESVLSSAAFNATDAATYSSSTSLSLYDSQGYSHGLTTYFVKTAANAWDVFASLDGTPLGAGPAGTLNFLPSGAIDTASTALPLSLSMPIATGAASPLVVDLDLAGSTQFGSPFGVTQLTQDGYASGRLTGFTISDDGVVIGRYSNGQTRPQGQIVLVSFNSPQGLQPLGSNAWSETAASGQPLVGAPGSGNLGVLQAGAIEESNIDLTAELVAMITAQRVYQANAQSIKTMDQTLQTIVNLR